MGKLIIAMLSFLFLTLSPSLVFAEENQLLSNDFRLPANADKPVNFEIFGNDKKPLKSPQIRGADQFQAEWRLDVVETSNLISDGSGNLYFTDNSNTLYSVSGEGKINWKYSLKDAGMEWFPELKLGKDGLIYALTAGSLLKEDSKQGAVFVFDTKGHPLWSTNLSKVRDYIKYDIDSNGNIIVATDDGIVSVGPNGKTNWMNKDILVLTKEKGSLFNWTNDNVSNIYTDYDGSSYILINDKKLFALDSNGKEKWNFSLSSFDYDENHIYFEKNHQFFMVNDSGVHVFDNASGKKLVGNTIDQQVLDDLGVPNDGDGGYYLNYDFNGIEKLDKNGLITWKYRTPDRQYGWAHEIMSDKMGNLYFVDDGGNIYSLDKEGKERFIFVRNNSDMTGSKLSISKNGNLFCLTEDVGLMALERIMKPIEVFINDKEQFYSQEPIVINGNTLVPMRDLFQSLGAEVQWNNEERSVQGIKDKIKVQLKVDSKDAVINNHTIELEVEPAIINGKTMIPLRVVAEAFGANIQWDDKNKKIRIIIKS